MTGKKRKGPPDKRTQIVKVAGAMFIAHGFDAVSMDALAEAVPVSKPTLYNHFDDKKALFKAVMEERCASAYQAFDDSLQEGGGPEIVLKRFGATFLDLILSPTTLGLYRLMMAEAQSFPELGALFYADGPRKVHARLAEYLAATAASGQLHVPDPVRSASLLLAMIKIDYQTKRLLGVAKSVDPAERRAGLDYGLAMFLKAHAATAVDGPPEGAKSKA